MRAAEHTPDQTPVILVIDDEDYVADMIASALKIEGYVTHVAYNGRDGLQQAQDTSVDLIILDIMMPYINGIDLIDRLRAFKHLRRVPIILISAGARPPQSIPHVRFIPKPFDMEQMLHYIAHDLASTGQPRDT